MQRKHAKNSIKDNPTFKRVMREFKQGQLHSGNHGPLVTNPRQAVAIAYSETRKSGAKVPPNPKKKKH